MAKSFSGEMLPENPGSLLKDIAFRMFQCEPDYKNLWKEHRGARESKGEGVEPCLEGEWAGSPQEGPKLLTGLPTFPIAEQKLGHSALLSPVNQF